MIKIVCCNGDVFEWKDSEYTDYKYDGKCFIVIKDDKWVGFYNLDSVRYIAVN